MARHIYVHNPFCARKCPYCDFYSVTDRSCTEAFYKAAIREVELIASVIGENTGTNPLTDIDNRDTVYFGGGTPSFLGTDILAEIISHIHTAENCEMTVECNPSDACGNNPDFSFETLAAAGVNRISMGLQSAVDNERKALGRRAGKNEVENAVRKCIESGIDNISLDLMLGVPGQTSETLDESIEFCASTGARHISAYILKIEEGTYFYKNAGKLNLPDEEATAEMYLRTVEKLSTYGFNQYEISNFTHKGYESRHNLKYWHCEEYLGIGPSAHSFIDGKRMFYPRDIEYFLSGGAPEYDCDGGDPEEYIMLALRLTEGLDLVKLKERYGIKPDSRFYDYTDILSEKGLAVFENNRLKLTPNGFLVSNSVICEIIDRI